MNHTRSASPAGWLRLFAIDLRALALFRMALGALVLAHLASRVADFSVFYTEEGVWPVAVAWAEDWAPGMWSLHLLHGSTAWQAGLFAGEALAGLALLLGWKTRTVAVLTWILVASAHKRDVMVISAAGSLLRQFLFWGMWLPLGARWSLDARLRPRSGDEPTAVLSVASAALLLQVAVVYWANVIYKSDPAWRIDGTAVWMALSQQTYARPLGRMLLEYPGFLRALTHGAFVLEAIGPILAFLPWRNARWRGLAVVSFVIFHAALGSTMYLGLFPWVSIAGWLPFLPGALWARSGGDAVIRAPRWAEGATAAAFFLMLAWNLRPAVPPLKILDPAARMLRLEQRWAMFAPRPREVDSWVVVVGTDAAGRETNLWTGESPVNWRAPRDFATFFPRDLWKLYFLNLQSGSGPRARLLAEWLARRWARAHPDAPPFVKLEVFHLEESIRQRGATPSNLLLYDSSDPAPSAP